MSGFDGLARHAHYGSRGSITLGASVIAAATGSTVGFDGDVSKLAGHSIHTVKNFAIQNDRTADAGSQRDHGHVVDVARSAEPLFAQCGCVGVILEKDASAQAAFDFIAHGIFGPPR